jgi:hypothetical protein
MSKASEQREFYLGVLWAAWWLHHAHGEDMYAELLMRESGPISTFQRLARREEYHFKRSFWAIALKAERDAKELCGCTQAKQ